MLKTTILVCLLAANPDPSTCTPETAVDVVAFPPRRAAICGNDGQATLAHLAIAPEPGTSYTKILCERVRP